MADAIVRPGCQIDLGVGRVLFAGEIAGFLNPMGEGISVAIESGKCAACAIAARYDDPEAVRAYYQQVSAELADYMKRQWSITARMSHKFADMKI